jgi:Mg-chelatase subunit ChlD
VALRGAYQHVREHLAANPGRRVAVILATDGVPSSCMPKDAAGIAADIRMAQMGTPSILTYVIGVFAADDTTKGRPTVEMFATAGGTGAPYVLDANANLGARLNEALAAIRGQTLPCEFTIPSGTGTIDFGKVNVTLQAAGAEQTIPTSSRPAAATRCGAAGTTTFRPPPANRRASSSARPRAAASRARPTPRSTWCSAARRR